MQHAMFGCVEFKLLIILQNNQIKTQKLLHIMSNLWCCVAKEELKKSTTSLNAKTFLLKSCHVMILGAEGITSFEMKKKITKKKTVWKCQDYSFIWANVREMKLTIFLLLTYFHLKAFFWHFQKWKKPIFDTSKLAQNDFLKFYSVKYKKLFPWKWLISWVFQTEKKN